MAAYVVARDSNVYIGQSRVTFQTLIEAWQSGRTPEQLQDSFPSLPLVAIYGAITHYLEHRDESDAFFRETNELDARRQQADEAAYADFYADMRRRMEQARRRLGAEFQAS